MTDPAASSSPIGTRTAGGARSPSRIRRGVSGPRPNPSCCRGRATGSSMLPRPGCCRDTNSFRSSGDTTIWLQPSPMPGHMIVTDTNRDQARHWRGSQDTRGHTEPGGPDADVLTPTAADQRLAVFDDDADSRRSPSRTDRCRLLRRATASRSPIGPKTAPSGRSTATPLLRGGSAIMATHGRTHPPHDHRARLDDESLRLAAGTGSERRSIDQAVRITVDDEPPIDVTLDESSSRAARRSNPAGEQHQHDRHRDHGVAPGDPPRRSARRRRVRRDRPRTRADNRVDPAAHRRDRRTRASTDPPLCAGLHPLACRSHRPVAFGPRATPAPTIRAALAAHHGRQRNDAPGPACRRCRPRSTPRVGLGCGGPHRVGPRHRWRSTARAAAVDGDPTTAWMTPFDGAVGATLRFDELGSLGDSLVIDQPTEPPRRSPCSGSNATAPNRRPSKRARRPMPRGAASSTSRRAWPTRTAR